MRKILIWTVTALAVAATPALADVFTNADISKDKDKRVVELILKGKVAAILVIVTDVPEKFAESEAISNQRNEGNSACENCAEKHDEISESASDNSGIVSINQAAGNMNNQGTAIAFSVDVGGGLPGTDATGFAESQASVEQVNDSNVVDTVRILFRDSHIENAGNNNTGVLYMNQAAGNINNQANDLSVAVSLVPGVALSEADLGQWNAGNSVDEVGQGNSFINKLSEILSSINGNSGIVGVNQTSGNMANQANVVSLAAAISP
jgi:hypothetical protein